MKALLGIVVVGAVVGGIFVLNGVTRDEEGRSVLHVAREPEVMVDATRPEVREIIRTVQAPGEVEAIDEVDISSEIVAKILEMPVEEGDFVEQGDLLCRLDDADYRAHVLSGEANVARLRAAIAQAEAEVEKARLDYEQEKRLIELGATSVDTVNQYRTVLRSAEALVEMRKHELRAAEASLESARETLEKTVIRAPISGVIAQRFAEQGEVVVTGTMNNPGTRILVINDLSQMQVRCRVDEADAPLVAAEQAARVFLQSDTRDSITGKVLRVGTKGTKPLGRDVVSFETLVLITGEDDRVRPGMTANVEIEVARETDARVVPVESVVYRRRRDLPEELVAEYERRQCVGDPNAVTSARAEYLRVVFCVADGRAQPRLVETGISDATGVEITHGLTADEVVIAGPYRSLDQLRAGTVVKVNDKHVKIGQGDDDAATADEPNDADAAAKPAGGAEPEGA